MASYVKEFKAPATLHGLGVPFPVMAVPRARRGISAIMAHRYNVGRGAYRGFAFPVSPGFNVEVPMRYGGNPFIPVRRSHFLLGMTSMPPRHQHGLGDPAVPTWYRYGYRPRMRRIPRPGLAAIQAGNDFIGALVSSGGGDTSTFAHQELPIDISRGVDINMMGDPGGGASRSFLGEKLGYVDRYPWGGNTFLGQTATLGPDQIPTDNPGEDPKIQAYISQLMAKATDFGGRYRQFQDDYAWAQTNSSQLATEGGIISATVESARAKIDEINRLVDSTKNWIFDTQPSSGGTLYGADGIGFVPLIVGAVVLVAAIALVSDAIVKMDQYHQKVLLVQQGKLSGSALDTGASSHTTMGDLAKVAMWAALGIGALTIVPKLFRR